MVGACSLNLAVLERGLAVLRRGYTPAWSNRSQSQISSCYIYLPPGVTGILLFLTIQNVLYTPQRELTGISLNTYFAILYTV